MYERPKTGLKRNSISEKYYTKLDVARNLVDTFNRLFPLSRYRTIIEPSGGSGTFIEALKEYIPEKSIISFDIEPEHPLVKKCDFLKEDLQRYKNFIVIGNPPFGRQSSIAKKFIKHSSGAELIAFILPLSFKKESMYRSFDMNYHKVYELELEKNSFTHSGKDYQVPCVFQIWQKKSFKRLSEVIHSPNNNYSIEKDYTTSNLAFKRVGGNAGNFKNNDLEKLSPQSHIFIKYINLDQDVIERLKSIEWCFNNTVGPKSISKNELIKNLNKLT